MTSVEALVRWNHPQLGRVMPGDFIHLAEQTGLINPLTTIVLETAIREWSQPAPVPRLAVAIRLRHDTSATPAPRTYSGGGEYGRCGSNSQIVAAQQKATAPFLSSHETGLSKVE